MRDARPGAATGHRRAAEIEYLPYAAPSAGDQVGGERTLLCELVAAFGPVEPEYAAIRRGAALFDASFTGTIEVRGKDRREFLQRMVTQDIKSLAAGFAARSFWLNRKGRIEADLTIIELGERMLIALDAGCAASTVATLNPFVFSELVTLRDATDEWHWLELHGPGAGRALALAGAATIPARGEVSESSLSVPGAPTAERVPVVLVRDDALGETGWRIGVAFIRAVDAWDAIMAAIDPHDAKQRVRPIGWQAYNIARIEAGTPRFLVDFGTSNLPHETGILAERVSFKKGCYLGQEVVARMESLGKPKQKLVGVRPAKDLLPVAEAQIFERAAEGAMGQQIGLVTSSTLAPMLGAVPVAFAMIKTAFAASGTTVLVNAEGEQCEATVGPLRSWPHEVPLGGEV